MNQRFTLYILAGMILGLAAGASINAFAAHPKDWADALSLLTEVFLRLIKMIIAPLVLSTLIAGIAHMGDGKAIGRVGAEGAGLVRGRRHRLADHRHDRWWS